MNGDTIIRVENVAKRYRISHLAGKQTIRDSVPHLARLAWRKLRWKADLQREDFWALRDINFEVKRGEVIGLIGRNGAGKSTLLKVLSRITEPTTGRIMLNGRVASLLEVGTGFHPELTGRDNVFLNGAIHGMSRREIQSKFDEIVAFAEVERFLDIPVKRYSSGMYVRLAFAVAAHIDPEILIIDEVLAVGDAKFQRKCLSKIREVSSDKGRAVLFVSHNLSSVRQLCSRAILLNQGTITADGQPGDVISLYNRSDKEAAEYRHIAGDQRAQITRISFSGDNSAAEVYPVFAGISIRLDFESKISSGAMEFFILIYTEEGECIAAAFQGDRNAPLTPGHAGSGSVMVNFTNILAPGRYLVSAGIFDAQRQFLDWVEYAESFEVDTGFSDGRVFDQRMGRISLEASWNR